MLQVKIQMTVINKTGIDNLLTDISELIKHSKAQIAHTVNSTLTYLYWKIGKRINEEVLENKRATYGKQIVVSLSRQLVVDYGRSFDEKNLRRMMQFAEIFSDENIVVSAIRQLIWNIYT